MLSPLEISLRTSSWTFFDLLSFIHLREMSKRGYCKCAMWLVAINSLVILEYRYHLADLVVVSYVFVVCLVRARYFFVCCFQKEESVGRRKIDRCLWGLRPLGTLGAAVCNSQSGANSFFCLDDCCRCI